MQRNVIIGRVAVHDGVVLGIGRDDLHVAIRARNRLGELLKREPDFRDILERYTRLRAKLRPGQHIDQFVEDRRRC